MDIDPQTVCGYNPCMVAKCILLPYATCVSDFKCRPVFFDSEERKVSQCTGEWVKCFFKKEKFCTKTVHYLALFSWHEKKRLDAPNVGLKLTTLRLRVSYSTHCASRARDTHSLSKHNMSRFSRTTFFVLDWVSLSIYFRPHPHRFHEFSPLSFVRHDNWEFLSCQSSVPL